MKATQTGPLVDELGIDVQPILAVIRRRMGMDIAWLSTFEASALKVEVVDGDGVSFGVRAGGVTALRASICARVADGRLPNIVADASAHPVTRDLPTTGVRRIRSYIGMPIASPSGETIGMLCAASDSSADLDDGDLEMLGSFGEIFGRLVAEYRRVSLEDVAIDRRERVRLDLAAGRLRSVLQPIVDIGTKAAVGVEALTRIDGDDVRPDVWFADAHAAGVGIEAELAAIALALDSFSVLPSHMYLSVNASPDTAVDTRLVDLLATSDPDRIVVEITEHERIDSYAAFAVGLEPLRRLGVRIAVDDVGAGFASFAHVLELKADIVKMDRSIVAGIDADPARQALASAILELAVRLDASVVAEGVETEAELAAVYAIGVDTAQGYLLHRPAPLADLSEMLDAGAALAPSIDSRPGTLRQAGRFELAMYHSPLAVAVVDLDGRIGEVNPAMCASTGFSEGELARLNVADLTHPDDLERSRVQAQRLIAGDVDHYVIRQRFVAATGDSLVTEATVVLVRTRSGRPLHFVLQFDVPAAA